MPLKTMEERFVEARSRYAPAIAAAIDAEVGQFILPSDRIAIIDDALAFTVFLLVTKKVETLRLAPDKGRLIATWNDVAKTLARSVPSALLDFAKEVAAP